MARVASFAFPLVFSRCAVVSIKILLVIENKKSIPDGNYMNTQSLAALSGESRASLALFAVYRLLWVAGDGDAVADDVDGCKSLVASLSLCAARSKQLGEFTKSRLG